MDDGRTHASRDRRLRARTDREQSLLAEVRLRLSRDPEAAARLRRLERMEHAARIWFNGQEASSDPRLEHLRKAYE